MGDDTFRNDALFHTGADEDPHFKLAEVFIMRSSIKILGHTT